MTLSTSRPLDCLAGFTTPVVQWFSENFDAPTSAQQASWPEIARGEHVLVTAPTGSGKTLTAFLWALNAFCAGRWETGTTRVLYVSPLKALNNDIQRNLLTPLEALTARGAMPPIRVETRSGDTPQNARQRMLRRPPEILITTPESLALLLTSARGRLALSGVETVILDEIHALVDNRRGALLLTALERLVELAGEFQRIALSATVRPLADIARYVAGRERDGTPRRMQVIEGDWNKQIQLRVCFPPDAKTAAERGEKIWEPLASCFRTHIARNQATLLFANSRRLAEKLTLKINENQPAPLAYAHHGSLARDIRLAVEQRLKAGELSAIVATSSLEMGIDIGQLDEVILIQAPPSIAATLQRVGRAGHRVGDTSRGCLFPTHAQDFVAAAALVEAVAEHDIEPLRPQRNPLDVLAQIIVSITASEPWHCADLLALLQRSGPYETLTSEQLDLVIEMLAGRYAGSRVRELQARISYDRINGTVTALRSAVLAYYNAGGVIPDRGYFQLRHADGGAVIGELDEEFVWEARLGQVFTLGTQNWRIHRITHNDVLVKPARSPATLPPFWRSETQNRSYHLSRRIGAFLAEADDLLSSGSASGLVERLGARHAFELAAAEELADYLQRQREATGAPLPGDRHLVMEQVRTGPGGYRGPGETHQLIIHSLWGGRVNRPWALALAASLDAESDPGSDGRPEIHADDNAIVVTTRSPLDPDRVLALVRPGNLDPLLRQALESSGFFGARFREAAGRALLVTRQRFNQRLPLWMSRLQSKKLLSTVRQYPDFPVLLETWRTCLMDEFDLGALHSCLAALEDGLVAVSRVQLARPSPFAANVSFGQINRYMYADDSPELTGPSSLTDELIRSALDEATLRPALEPGTVADFLAKRQRLATGYQPETRTEWLDWIKERVLVPEAEASPGFEHPYLVRIEAPDRAWYAHRELLYSLIQSGLISPAWASGPVPEVRDMRDGEQLALEMLSFYGPLREAEIRELLPRMPEDLLNGDGLVNGALVRGDSDTRFCERSAFEALLRLQRARQRPVLDPLPAQELPAFLFHWSGGGQHDAAESDDTLSRALEPLLNYRAPVRVWLEDLPACRIPGSRQDDLERWVRNMGLAWRGAGREQIRLGYWDDLALLRSGADAPAGGRSTHSHENPNTISDVISDEISDEISDDVREHDDSRSGLASLFADPAARYDFLQLADRQDEGLARFNERWWEAVWRGEITADSLEPLRRGLLSHYRLGGLDETKGHPQRLRRRRGRTPRYPGASAGLGWSGNWLLTQPAPDENDPLTALEDAKDRARMLLERYGFVCRELANREGGPFRWGGIFRALRMMELAGEVLAGLFFQSLSGPQFALPGAIRRLSDHGPPAETFWMSSQDPASPCGLGLDWPALPKRRAGNYLSFHAGALALVVENYGKRLHFQVSADHPSLAAILAPVSHVLAHRRRITLTSINGEHPAESPYRAGLDAIGRFVTDHRQASLEDR